MKIINTLQLRAKSLLLLVTAAAVSISVFADVDIKADRIYGHKDGMAMVYDVIQPENPNGAAIIYMVSGGWFSGWSPAIDRLPMAADMLDAGFTFIPVHHGSSPRYLVPDAYADVSRAIRHIRMHAEEYGIDADRLGVTGGSAGGHLSLMIGLDSDQGNPEAIDEVMRYGNEVAAVVAYFPPVDLRPMAGPSERFPALNFEEDLAASISPILFADPNDPPTLLIHGDADTLVNISNSEIMQTEFEKQGVESHFITIPGGTHGFRGEHATTANAARLQWFKDHLN